MFYPKIHSIYKRDSSKDYKTFIEGMFAMPEFEYLKDCEWIWTEKVDGTNTRIVFDGTNVMFGGRTENAQVPSKLLSHLITTFTVDKFKKAFDDDCTEVILFGEGYGGAIQDGAQMYRLDESFILFDVYVHGWWLKREDVIDVAVKMGIEPVPVLGSGPLDTLVRVSKEGFESRVSDFDETIIAEGVVARPKTDLFMRNGERVILKLKFNDFERKEE